jgi:hypothetical protein
MSEIGSPISAIEAIVATYVKGMTGGDAALLRQAFHPGAEIIGHFDGGLEWDDLDAFIAVCKKAAKPETEAAFFRIRSIIVTGDTAVAQVEDEWDGMRFDDTLTLLLHDGRWQIVSKLFHHRS